MRKKNSTGEIRVTDFRLYYKPIVIKTVNTVLAQKQTHRHREHPGGCQQGVGGGGGIDWEFGVSRCKLVYIGWINIKVLLFSTGNYIQYPVTNHNGKEYEKEHI